MAKGDDKAIREQLQPMTSSFGYNYGRGSEANWADYQDIMNRYRMLAPGGGYTPPQVGVSDPFGSYGGFQEFSKTGGFSPEDIANMRARGVSPIRSAYANAEREMSRQRTLQGGYSPNFMAASAKMAREQGQGAADALQNVNAGLAQMIQSGRLAGLGGMSDIERARLSAQLQASMFNAERNDPLRTLSGMTSLYGTTPAMAQLFGNQMLQGAGAQTQAAQLPTSWDYTLDRIGQVGDIAGGMIYPWLAGGQ